MANTMKITKKMRYETLLTLDAVKEIDGMVDFINHELELLSNKSASKAKAKDKTSAENAVIATMIENAMEQNMLYRASEIQALVPELMPPYFTLSKITSVLGQMCDAGVVVNTREKGKSFYSLA